MALLDTSYGFTSGDLNTGLAGGGWGINTSIFFQVEDNKEFILPHTGGLVIDLYSLVYMNPIEKIDFLVDFSTIDLKYIEVKQDQNLLYLIPNTSKILEDNYLSNIFLVNVELIGSNGSNKNINIIINYIIDSSFEGANNYSIIYNNMDYKIPLNCLLKNSSSFSATELETLQIKYINGLTPDNFNVDTTALLAGGTLNVSEIDTILNPIIDWEYNINNNIYKGTLKFINIIENLVLETQISNIPIYITPISGSLFDVKKYVTGDTQNLKIKSVSEVLPLTTAFKVENIGHYISIIPNTKEFFKLETSRIFIQKYIFETNNTKGVFDLYITANPKAIANTSSILNALVPQPKTIELILTNNKLDAGYYNTFNGINLEPLLDNRIFDPLKPLKINFKNPINGLQLNNVNGPHLFNDQNNTSTIPTDIYFEISYNNSIVPYANPNIKISEDKVLYREPFSVAPISLYVTKNNSEFTNIFDYITAPKNYLDNMEIESLDQNILFNILGTDFISCNPLLFQSTATFKGPETKTIETTITVKNPKIFTNVSNKDDFGNIIGLRSIPVTIYFDSINNEVETDETLIFKTLKIRLLSSNLTGTFNLNMLNIIKNINNDSILQSKSSILDIIKDSSSTLDWNLTYDSNITDQKALGTKNIGIVWDHKNLYLSGNLTNLDNIVNPKLVFNIRFQDHAGANKDYTQIINFI